MPVEEAVDGVVGRAAIRRQPRTWLILSGQYALCSGDQTICDMPFFAHSGSSAFPALDAGANTAVGWIQISRRPDGEGAAIRSTGHSETDVANLARATTSLDRYVSSKGRMRQARWCARAVRYIGSPKAVDRIAAALAIPGVEKFVSSQPQYSLLHREPKGRCCRCVRKTAYRR